MNWLAARLVAIAALMLVGACSDGDSGSSPKETGAAAATLPNQFSQLREGKIAAGETFTTEQFDLPFTVTVSAPVFGVDTKGVVVLVTNPDETIRDPWLTFTSLDHVQVFDDPLLAPEEIEGDRLDANLQPLPRDVGRWLLGLPALGATEAARADDVAGRRARVFDFAVRDVPDGRGPCTEYACVAFDYTDGDQPGIGIMAEGVRGRAFLVPADDPTLLILAGARMERWDAFLPMVERTLAKLALR